MIRLRLACVADRLVLSLLQPLPYTHVCRQSGPQHGPGGGRYDQEPPEHPHDVLGYQNLDIKIGDLKTWYQKNGGVDGRRYTIYLYDISRSISSAVCGNDSVILISLPSLST